MSDALGVRVTAAADTFDGWRRSPAGLAVPATDRSPSARPAAPTPAAVATAFAVFATCPVTVSLALAHAAVRVLVHAAALDGLAALVVRVVHLGSGVPDWVQTVVLPLGRAGEEAIAWLRPGDAEEVALGRLQAEVCRWDDDTVRERFPLAARSSWADVAGGVVAALAEGEGEDEDEGVARA